VVIAVVQVIGSVLHAKIFGQRGNEISPYGYMVPFFDGQRYLGAMMTIIRSCCCQVFLQLIWAIAASLG
jgi:hypothetical protein